ncbi:MAG: hypothetical protein Q9166_005132 [cf. Caloplaca sp. 2 TL-2023]
MSLDLLQEFGSNPSPHDALTNPCTSMGSHDMSDNGPPEEDDFGDFEQAEALHRPEEAPKHNSVRSALAMTTGLNRSGPLIDAETTKPPPSPSFHELNAPLTLAIPTKSDRTEIDYATSTDVRPEESTPVTAWPSYGRDRAKSFGKPLPLSPYTEDDDWGDFEENCDLEHTVTEAAKGTNPNVQTSPTKGIEQTSSLLNLMDSFETSTLPPAAMSKPARLSTAESAPSNIPPPSVLLSSLTTVILSQPDEIQDIVTSISASLMGGAFSAHDTTFENLLGHIYTMNTAARVLAGRKLRWKRDTHLAQRMSIGPANSGKTGGMKLTGVDRTETRREDQEAAELVKLWKQQLGGYKSHIAKINAQQSEVKFTLPEIADNILIRVAKVGEGGLTALKCCFLCGLKRDERVARLDVNVEDSFGEWWVDHWGHVDCVWFWKKHKDSLK